MAEAKASEMKKAAKEAKGREKTRRILFTQKNGIETIDESSSDGEIMEQVRRVMTARVDPEWLEQHRAWVASNIQA